MILDDPDDCALKEAQTDRENLEPGLPHGLPPPYSSYQATTSSTAPLQGGRRGRSKQRTGRLESPQFWLKFLAVCFLLSLLLNCLLVVLLIRTRREDSRPRRVHPNYGAHDMTQARAIRGLEQCAAQNLTEFSPSRRGGGAGRDPTLDGRGLGVARQKHRRGDDL
ncbi:hypothetical protein DFH06DRAFT_1200537 [Mycena polygramma]|nr:hypothetical protein DFH06DRAFT_1200537 [Mycena polygramma]